MEIKVVVRTQLLDALKDRLEKKINKPARKLGLPEAVILRDGDPFTKPYAPGTYESGARYYNEITEEKAAIREGNDKPVVRFEFSPILLVAEEAKLAGFEFIATIEHTEAGNLLRVQPDHEETLPAEYRTAGNVCDHCGYDRKRKDTYIVRHIESDTFKQVGRSCIKDFLGHGDPEQIATYFDNLLRLWSDLAAGEYDEWDEGLGGSHAEIEIGTVSFLAVVAESIQVNGWLSKGKAYDWGGNPTAHIAWDWCSPFGDKSSAKLLKDYGFDTISEESKKLAKLAHFWASTREGAEVNDSDYLYNLKVACTLDSVTGRRSGIVASAITAYQRFVSTAAKVEADEVRKADAEPVPITDERVTLTGKILSTKWVQGEYGSQFKGLLEAPEGFRLWGTIPSKLDDVQIGDVIQFDAKITRSNDDKTFGFWNRPTKPAIIERAPVEDNEEEVAA